jgi:hypothetical protein
VEKLEGKRRFEKYKHRWDGNTNTCFREVRCDSVDWIDLDQDRYKRRGFMKTAMELRVPFKM